MSKAPVLVISFLWIFLTASETFAAPRLATYEGLLRAIRETRASTQARIETAVEKEKVREAWETGKLIQEHILLNKERADYGEQVIKRLADDLGISKRELHYMVEFARTYRIVPTSAQLSWGHYRDLLAVNDPEERSKIERFAEDRKLPIAELRREIKRRKLATAEEPVGELPEITPGPLNTYQIIRLKDRLKIDLGFGLYLDLPEKDAKKFKEGDIAQSNVGAGPRARLSQGAHRGAPLQKIPNAKPADLFTYTAAVIQVVDGDTFHALIDLGFGITVAQRVRLRRIDAPEIVSADGKEAKTYLEEILSRDQGRILIQTTDLDQHGRPIADVWVKGKSIDQEMLDKGFAVRISE